MTPPAIRAILFDLDNTLVDRDAAFRRSIARLTAAHPASFEPGQERDVTLVQFGGGRRVFGFNQKIMGDL